MYDLNEFKKKCFDCLLNISRYNAMERSPCNTLYVTYPYAISIILYFTVLNAFDNETNRFLLLLSVFLFFLVHWIRGGQSSRSDGTRRVRPKPNGQTQKGNKFLLFIFSPLTAF